MIDFGPGLNWTCDECPLVCELEGRLAIARSNPEEFKGEMAYFGLLDHCGCEKIDGKLWMWGGCEDAWADADFPAHKGSRRTGRAYRRAMDKKKTERQIGIVLHTNCPYLGTGIDKTGRNHHREYWDDNVTHTYIRRPKNSTQKNWLKKRANRQFRHVTDISTSEKRFHRKVFNVLWEMW